MNTPPQQPDDREEPNCPPEPATPPCPANVNAYLVSDGSWFSDIAVDFGCQIEGGSTSRVDGSVLECFQGWKTEIVYGSTTAVHRGEKHEHVIGLNTNFIMAGQLKICFINKNEISFAAMLEQESVSKWHLFVKGRRNIIGGEKLAAALKEEFLGQFKESYGTLERTVGNAVEKAKSHRNEYNGLVQKIGQFDFTVDKMNQKGSTCTWEAGSLTRKVKAKESIEGGDLTVNASSSVNIKGGKVKMMGSAAKIICASGKVHLFGTKMKVTK